MTNKPGLELELILPEGWLGFVGPTSYPGQLLLLETVFGPKRPQAIVVGTALICYLRVLHFDGLQISKCFSHFKNARARSGEVPNLVTWFVKFLGTTLFDVTLPI
ncbi:unnamed protein product [Prunus armeniaca]